MDPGKIASIKITLERIREEAEAFRDQHIFSDTLPVDIEHVVEATMGYQNNSNKRSSKIMRYGRIYFKGF